ncbi:MAG: peptidylprolyl isomerase, partial [Chitinophagaceae bacterium]|nr:peptidylprolyl isomerase [Chitinophagaceae bacterium]
MSVIQRIRDKGAWIIFGIIALALIAFILQDGVRRGGRTFSKNSTIGKVNGQKIEKADFDEKVQLQEQMYAGQGAQREQIMNSVWNQEVEMTVLGQEYEKLGLVVGQKELADILYGANSPLKSQFTDPKTGEFMAENARQAMAQIKKSKNTEQQKMINTVFVDPAIQQTLRTKYQNLLIQAAYLPKWMLEKQQADNNAIASFSYVYVPYATLPDSATKVSDDEIESYVKKHSKEYTKTEETRNISFVAFSAAPSKADSAATLNQVLAAKTEFANATDNKAFLTKAGSDMPFYDSYFSKARMQQSNKDTLVKIPVGQIYGPYLDGQNYVLAKMIGVKQWPDSAKVRHILIATVNQQGQQIREDSVAKKLADSLETAIKGGADFNAMVQKYSDDPGSKDKGGVYEFFPQGQMMIPFNDFAFDKPVGTKGVVKTDFGYHYMEVLDHKGNNPVYKLAYLAKGINASPETENAANTAAAQFAVSSKSSKEFNANVLKGNLPAMSATDIKQNDFIIQGVGNSRQLVRWMYENSVGDVSDPIQIGDKYVVAMITAVNKAGVASAAEARPMVENIIRNEKKAKIIIDTKFKGNTLESYSASTGAPILRSDSLSFSAPFISGVGSEPKVVGAVFNKASLNKVTGPIAGATGVFALRV